MKKSIVFTISIIFALGLNAGNCKSQYMSDTCPLDGYSIVEVEKFVKGTHNQMHTIHHFQDQKKCRRAKRRNSPKPCSA